MTYGHPPHLVKSPFVFVRRAEMIADTVVVEVKKPVISVSKA